ncbi:MAG: hypothetical protein IJ861_04570 [Clostridia bacterium]|nr:hypothetical protein [Clostridia bacterium]
MCEFFDRIEAKGKAAGIAEGRAEGRLKERETGIRNTVRLCKDFGADLEKTIRQLIELYSLSEDEAARKADEYWNLV